MAFALWALVDGSYTLIWTGIPHDLLGMPNPFQQVWWTCNLLADGYGWQPLFAEWDWEETLARVRRTIFPDEAQEVYGQGYWYGDGHRSHPGNPPRPICRGAGREGRTLE